MMKDLIDKLKKNLQSFLDKLKLNKSNKKISPEEATQSVEVDESGETKESDLPLPNEKRKKIVKIALYAAIAFVVIDTFFLPQDEPEPAKKVKMAQKKSKKNSSKLRDPKEDEKKNSGVNVNTEVVAVPPKREEKKEAKKGLTGFNEQELFGTEKAEEMKEKKIHEQAEKIKQMQKQIDQKEKEETKISDPEDLQIIEESKIDVDQINEEVISENDSLENEQKNETPSKIDDQSSIVDPEPISELKNTEQDQETMKEMVGEKDTKKIEVDLVQENQQQEITDMISEIEKDVKNEKTNQEKNKFKYVPPPDYNYPGRGLVYNCLNKHWACVDKVPYSQCRDHYLWSHEKKKNPLCAPIDVYASDKDCIRAQTYNINTLKSVDKCKI